MKTVGGRFPSGVVDSRTQMRRMDFTGLGMSRVDFHRVRGKTLFH
jgi:hypothetical protein